MKLLRIQAFPLLTFALVVLVSSIAAADTAVTPQLTVDLRDGSRVVGTSVEKDLKFRSDLLGNLKLAITDIRSVECLSSNTARLVTTGGDQLTVSFADSEFAIKTGFGRVELKVNSVRKISISEPGNAMVRHSGLVSWWRAEGNCEDSADNNNGVLEGNTTYGSGRIGQAFILHGQGGLVRVGNPVNLRLQNFTIEAWVQRSSTALASYGSAGNGIIFGYGFGGYGLFLDPSGCPTLSKIGVDGTHPNATISDTNFHHLAVTKSGNKVIFYIDGMAHYAPSYDTEFMFSTIAAIGARGDNWDNCFFGLIDEIAVYDHALTAAEIREDSDVGNGK